MNKSFLKLAVLGMFLLIWANSFSQVTTNRPYSVGGIGYLKQGGFIMNQFMGGLNSSISHDNNYNLTNPASLNQVKYTILQYGSSFNSVSQFNGVDTARNNSLQFDYISLAFPLFKNRDAAVSIGIRPKSFTNYFIQDEFTEFGLNVINKVEGKGNLNQLDIAYGMEVLKGLSLGASLNFLFGQLGFNQDKLFVNSVNQYSFQDNTFTYLNGFQSNFGVQYNGRIFKNIHHGFGAYYELGGNLNTTSDRLLRTYIPNGQTALIVDTVEYTIGAEKQLTLPTGFGVGYHIEKPGRWLLGAEYSQQSWSSFEGLNAALTHQDRTILSVGGYIQPKELSEVKRATFNERLKYYLGTTRFYFGYRNENIYTVYNGQTISEVGMNLGIGLPVIRYYKVAQKVTVPVVSRVFLGAEYVQRGTTDNGLLQEELWLFKIGITFNDRWFIKKKYQ
jgi:hypothetical protein